MLVAGLIAGLSVVGLLAAARLPQGALRDAGQTTTFVLPRPHHFSGSTQGPSYQTAPLFAYRKDLQERAEKLFESARQDVSPRQAKQYKGSYSFFGQHGSATMAKIVIIQHGRGRKNGGWPAVPDGVYVLTRASLNTNGATLGVAPKHEERFHYLEVTADSMEGAVQRILDALT